jgi:hypothetical protein
MCGISAIVIFVAILTGKFTDPEAWISVLLLCGGERVILAGLSCSERFYGAALKETMTG